MFPSYYVSLRDYLWSGRQSDLDQDILRDLLECYPDKSIQLLARNLNTYTNSQSAATWNKEGWGSILRVCFLRILTEKNKENCISIARNLCSSSEKWRVSHEYYYWWRKKVSSVDWWEQSRGPVGWGSRIHRLHLCMGLILSPKTSAMNMTLNYLIVWLQ